jgi:hypothetical protein
LVGGFGSGHIVSQACRDAVAIFDNGLHQGVPADIRRKGGGPHHNRLFYSLRVTQLIGGINFKPSPDLRPAGGGPNTL